MGARTGQFRRTMRAKFGPAKAEKAERCVTHLKEEYGKKSGRPFAICTSAMKGGGRSLRGR